MGRLKRAELARRDAARQAVRLGDLLNLDVQVFCWCNRCAHSASVPAAVLAASLGPAMPAPDVGARMRCSACGSRDVATRPDWPSLGEVTRHG